LAVGISSGDSKFRAGQMFFVYYMPPLMMEK
jgi:hypothetical protein